MSKKSADLIWDPKVDSDQMNSLDQSWDYTIEFDYLQSILKGSFEGDAHENLQLAAELGKTLLERNKELENIIKVHQSTIEEQAQEIEYMKKQTAALREVNNTRLKVYEQLEVSVQDLERANHHLVSENTSDKKLIKGQSVTIENLEIKCEEFQKKIDDLTAQIRQQYISSSRSNMQELHDDWETSNTQGGNEKQRVVPKILPISPKPSQETNATVTNDEKVTELSRQLLESRSQRVREQNKLSEVTQQLNTVLHENTVLEEQLAELRNKVQDIKTLQDEINTLEEVRRGQLCGRCLRGVDMGMHDELSIMLNQEEYDDISIAESLISENQRDSEQIQETSNKNEDIKNEAENANPYRVLVEKYQALLEMQRHCQPRRKDTAPAMSLQEELEMSGEFNNFYRASAEAETVTPTESTKAISQTKAEISGKKPVSATPTDFSEAETSSSGFSDETSNKATQTDGRGSFLCSIADGEDCKFSIYDDNSPFESRFRKTPEYRQLFSEIFSVLKRAAEAKDEGEKLPLLDVSTMSQTTFKSPMIQEDLQSEATDDNQSIISSMVSSVVSEPVFRVQVASPANVKNSHQADDKSNSIVTNQQSRDEDGCKMDYMSLNLRTRKKYASIKKNLVKKIYCDRSTPDVIPTTNVKFIPPKNNGRRRFRPFNPADFEHAGVWNDQHSACPNRQPKDKRQHQQQQHNEFTRNPSEQQKSYEYKDFKPSSASAEVARLKRLELSYAEVLRTPKTKTSNQQRRN